MTINNNSTIITHNLQTLEKIDKNHELFNLSHVSFLTEFLQTLIAYNKDVIKEDKFKNYLIKLFNNLKNEQEEKSKPIIALFKAAICTDQFLPRQKELRSIPKLIKLLSNHPNTVIAQQVDHLFRLNFTNFSSLEQTSTKNLKQFIQVNLNHPPVVKIVNCANNALPTAMDNSAKLLAEELTDKIQAFVEQSRKIFDKEFKFDEPNQVPALNFWDRFIGEDESITPMKTLIQQLYAYFYVEDYPATYVQSLLNKFTSPSSFPPPKSLAQEKAFCLFYALRLVADYKKDIRKKDWLQLCHHVGQPNSNFLMQCHQFLTLHHRYFHDGARRMDQLLKDKPLGTFTLRFSETNPNALKLTFVNKNRIDHLLLELDEKDSYLLKDCVIGDHSYTFQGSLIHILNKLKMGGLLINSHTNSDFPTLMVQTTSKDDSTSNLPSPNSQNRGINENSVIEAKRSNEEDYYNQMKETCTHLATQIMGDNQSLPLEKVISSIITLMGSDFVNTPPNLYDERYTNKKLVIASHTSDTIEKEKKNLIDDLKLFLHHYAPIKRISKDTIWNQLNIFIDLYEGNGTPFEKFINNFSRFRNDYIWEGEKLTQLTKLHEFKLSPVSHFTSDHLPKEMMAKAFYEHLVKIDQYNEAFKKALIDSIQDNSIKQEKTELWQKTTQAKKDLLRAILNGNLIFSDDSNFPILSSQADFQQAGRKSLNSAEEIGWNFWQAFSHYFTKSDLVLIQSKETKFWQEFIINNEELIKDRALNYCQQNKQMGYLISESTSARGSFKMLIFTPIPKFDKKPILFSTEQVIEQLRLIPVGQGRFEIRDPKNSKKRIICSSFDEAVATLSQLAPVSPFQLS